MPTKIRLAVGAVALVGSGLLIGAAVTGGGATAADGSGSTPSASSTPATPPTPPKGAPHEHTDVTGTELAKVTAAVKAHDSAITVKTVRKDPDGSYDVDGTKAGKPVALDVSKDLKTFTERTGGPGGRGDHGPGGPGGPGGSQDTAVTGAELSKVTAAVKAHDSAITVTGVRQDPDGSYDVFGTKAGAPVALDVSKDLKTFTERTGGPGGHGGPGGPGGHGGPGAPGADAPDAPAAPDSAPSSGSSAAPSSYRTA